MHDTDTFKKNLQEYYDVEEELGSGQFAVVRKLVEKETGDEFAGKYVRKKRTKASRSGMSREDIKREIEILRLVDSEKIIKVHEVYETDREMILIMELLRGGELFDYISKKDFLTEEEAIDFTRQILQGLQHLHSRNVVHLDLKPENILLKNTRRKTIKLVDFGLARVVKENEQVREIMGTPEFVAPEVLNFDTISTATDMWALGVIAYILLSGASPFLGEDNQETFTNIIQVDYQFDEEYFNEISDEAKDFIRKLLVKDPRKRPTAHDCSRHTWVEEEVVDKKKRQRRRTTQICTFNFKRFVARKRWKMSFNKIRAMNLIAKMGIKPPPGFVATIPPMMENDVTVEKEKDEDTSTQKEHKDKDHKEHKEHRDHKKNASTINRKKHKQHSSPKASVEKTDSLTLKTMDIDIGEANAVGDESEHVPSENEIVSAVEPSQATIEPIDYGTMSLRQKRRARGQLRHDEIVKSKKEIDAKKSKLDDETTAVQNNANSANVETREPEAEPEAKPENVTSTIHIDHKPGGILKKRDSKSSRIPSTEDNYFVTLDAVLHPADDTPFLPEDTVQQVTPPHPHGILKHSHPHVSPEKPTEVSKTHEETNSGELNDGAVSAFKIEVEVPSKETPPPEVDSPVAEVEIAQDSKTADQVPEKDADSVDEKSCEASVSSVKRDRSGSGLVKQHSNEKAAPEGKNNKTATTVPQLTKTTAKNNGGQQQQQFTPPPWKTQRKISNENLKPALQGVSKVSLKKNRFLSNDKLSSPKSPTGPAALKPSNVLGKSKVFQKENAAEKSSQDLKKAAATKTNSLGGELKAVECDINLDEPEKAKRSSESKESSERKASVIGKNKEAKEVDSLKPQAIGAEISKARSDGHSKPRSDSQSKVRSSSVNLQNNKNQTNKANLNRPRSSSTRNSKDQPKEERKIEHAPEKTKVLVNGDNTRSDLNDSKRKSLEKSEKVVSQVIVKPSVEKEEEKEVKDELTSLSSHSLTEFTITPRRNSGDAKNSGFDVMLTIGPQDQPPPDSRVASSSIKSKFASSSSSSIVDTRVALGVPNGKLASASAIDVTTHSRETATTADRQGAAQAPKYNPKRDFSKYLTSEQPKATANTPKISTPVRQKQPVIMNRNQPTLTPTTKGKKQAISSTLYVPRRSFGFTTKPTTVQTEFVIKAPSEADDTPKRNNNNDQSKRWSQSSNASDRSASSGSSEESSVYSVSTRNSLHDVPTTGHVNRSEQVSGNGNPKDFNISQKLAENHSSANLSPRASPVLERKWKATLVLPKECEKAPLAPKDRDIRISNTNAPRKNKFTNVRSMWEGK